MSDDDYDDHDYDRADLNYMALQEEREETALMKSQRDALLAVAKEAERIAMNHEQGFSCQDGVAGALPDLIAGLYAAHPGWQEWK